MNLKKSEPTADGTESGAERGELTGKLLLVGGGVVALVGAGALAFVLMSGGDEPLSTSALPTPSASAPAPTETASPSTSASIPTYAAKNARDPFKALVTEGSGSSDGSAGAPTASSVPTTGISNGSSSPVTGVTTSSAPPVQVDRRSANSLYVSMEGPSLEDEKSFGLAYARFEVGEADKFPDGKTKIYKVDVGDTFGTYFKLVRLWRSDVDDTYCSLLQYGDATFELCAGDYTVVR
jgi:hypothetical protein